MHRTTQRITWLQAFVLAGGMLVPAVYAETRIQRMETERITRSAADEEAPQPRVFHRIETVPTGIRGDVYDVETQFEPLGYAAQHRIVPGGTSRPGAWVSGPMTPAGGSKPLEELNPVIQTPFFTYRPLRMGTWRRSDHPQRLAQLLRANDNAALLAHERSVAAQAAPEAAPPWDAETK